MEKVESKALISNVFTFNEFGVCTNPEIVWYFMPKGALAWAYLQIEVAYKDGLWCEGYASIAGGSPCSLPRFKSKEEAIEQAIKGIKVSLNSDSGLLSKDKRKQYLDAFNKWRVSRIQYQIFN